MKKILSLLALLMLCIVGANAEKVIYYYANGITSANSVTLAEGVTLAITGNTGKSVSSGNSIKVDGTSYKSIKLSNGAQNTLTLPKAAKAITFYSYVNADDGEAYWKEVNGVEYDAETSGGVMTSFKNGNNPDVRTFTFAIPTDTITFTNAGKQLCYVMEVEYVVKQSVTFTKPNDWEKVYVWAWNGSGDASVNIFDQWPGLELTANDEDKYVWETTASPEHLLFNDGGNNQTSDFDFFDGAEYTVNGIAYSAMTLVGDLAGAWEIANGWAMNHSTEDTNVWTVTKENITLSPGDYGFKAVANGAWGICDIPATSGENYILNITAKGIYTITATVNTNDKSMNIVAEKTANVPIEGMTVVGTFLGLEGDANWAFENGWTLDKDTVNASLWSLTREDVELKVGEYSYKIVANADWNDYQLPKEGNATFTCEEDGVYKLEFTANTESGEFSCIPTKAAEINPIYIYAVVGEGGIFTARWDEANTTDQMTLDEESGLYTWTVKNALLEPQAIQLKVIKKAVNVTEETIWYPEQNYIIEIPEAGYYTITVTFDAEKGEVAATKTMREIPVYADNNVYFWESPDGVQDQNGGTAVHNNGERVNYFTADYYTICLNGKNDYSTDVITITLKDGVSLEVGDQISITAFRNKDTSGKKSGARLKFDSGKTIDTGNGTEFVNINAAVSGSDEYGTEPNTITIEAPAAAEGSKTIQLTRSQTGTNLFITKIDITRPAPTRVIDDGAYYLMDANSGRLITANGYDSEGSPVIFACDTITGTYTITGANIFKDVNWSVRSTGDGLTCFISAIIDGEKKYVVCGSDNVMLSTEPAEWQPIPAEYWENEVLSYNIAGSADLCGVEWDANANKMTKNTETGLYEWTAKDITVSNDVKPEFKVAVNNTINQETVAWYPEMDNWIITPDVTGSEGIFNIIITFNNATKEIAVAAEKQEPVLNTYAATFTTNAGWEKVYAYAWSGEGDNAVKFLGDWPGTELKADSLGTYTVTIEAAVAPEKIIFNNGVEVADKQQTEDLAFEDGKAYEYIAPVEYLLGDANIDGEVTTSDAVLAVSFVLKAETPTEVQFLAADVDKSNDITVSDAKGIVNIALEIVPETEPETNGARMFGGDNYLTMDGQTVNLTNAIGFAGFQMDVTLTAGAQFNGVQLAERAAGMMLAYNRIGENTWRIIALSLDNSLISGNDGALLTLNIMGNGNISVNNVEFTDAAARAYVLGFNGEATGINSVNGNNAEADVYNMNGVRINTMHKGMNIIRNANGEVKKILIK